MIKDQATIFIEKKKIKFPIAVNVYALEHGTVNATGERIMERSTPLKYTVDAEIPAKWLGRQGDSDEETDEDG